MRPCITTLALSNQTVQCMMTLSHSTLFSAAPVGPDPNGYSDQELMRQLLKRESWALEILFKRYGERGVRFAQRVGVDAELAQEIVAEAFWRIWTQANRFQPVRGSFGGWFYRIVHNLAVDELRRNQRRSRMQDRVQAEYIAAENIAHDDWETLADRIDAERVQAALDCLPEQQRSALYMVYVEGMTRREISRHLGIPVGTIHTRVRLGREKLKALLNEAPLMA